MWMPVPETLVVVLLAPRLLKHFFSFSHNDFNLFSGEMQGIRAAVRENQVIPFDLANVLKQL